MEAQRIEIRVSKYQVGVTGADNCFDIGDRAIATPPSTGKRIGVKIDSKLMKHDEAPGDGLVYECIIDDPLPEGWIKRCCLSAEALTPDPDEIAKGIKECEEQEQRRHEYLSKRKS